jgi:hypothetical protein
MKERIIQYLIAALCFTSIICNNVYCDNFGIFVNGGYSPGENNTDMDNMVDGRVDKAKDIWEKKTGGHGTKVKHKQDLLDALKNIKCKCGDVVTLFMVGHGSKSDKNPTSFCFVKDKDSYIEADELRKALKNVAVECCCKIHVVIFSCFSGAFLKKLFDEEHVMSVYTSSTDNEETHSDAYNEDGKFIDGGDWMKGFNEDWENDTNKTDQGAGLQKASESAKEKMPDQFSPTDHPQGWRRGEFPVYAHVSKREIDDKDKKIKKLWLHFYEPEFVRCTTHEVDVSGVDVPLDVVECKWVKLKIRFGHPVKDKLVAVSDVEIVDPPKEEVLVHVRKVIDKKTIEVHFIQPKWLYCKVKNITVEPPGRLDPKVKTCNYVRVKINVNNPDKDKENFSTGDNVSATDVTFKCKLHIDDVKREKGEITGVHVTVLEPPWVEPKDFWLPLSPEDREKIKKLKMIKCTNIVGDVTFHTNDTQTISGMKLVTNEGTIKKFSYDAAVHQPALPVFDEHTRIYKSSISVTNVGSETISFPVYVVICKLSDKNLIAAWWKSGEGDPSGVWFDKKQVNNLPEAQTQTINFIDWQVPVGNETYWIGFRTSLKGDENPASDTVSTILNVIESVNLPPVLSGEQVIPDSGNINTSFTYKVIYTDTDNDAPTEKDVYIDNTPYSMLSSGNNYSEGVEFTYQKTLTAGNHSFYFKFDDGHGHQVNSNTYTGPLVASQPSNQPPILSNGYVQPDSGFVYSPFIYHVRYADADNDPPTEYKVYIDNVPYNMIPQGNNWTTGVDFIFQRTLNPGVHNFYFHFNDGHGHIVEDTHVGPFVHN